MSINLWIINEYAGSPYHGMTYRHYYLARRMNELGVNVTIISGSTSHLFYKEPEVTDKFTKENIDGIDYIWIKTPKNSRAKSLGRIRNWFLFAYKLLRLPDGLAPKPDCIVASSLPLHSVYTAEKLARRYNAKFIFEVRDIWPLSAIELGGYSPRHPFIMMLQWLEDFGYQKADKVISVLPGALPHMVSRGMDSSKFNYVPNGILIEDISETERLTEEILRQLPENKFIVGYTGTLGTANAMEYFIEAAKLLCKNDNIAFIIVGDGAVKQDLAEAAKGYDNIIFIDPIPKKLIQSMLGKFDVCYLGWRAIELYKYGISANKIFDYMYSGKPIINSINSDNDPIRQAGCGLTVKAEDPEAIAEGIMQLYSMSTDERNRLGDNAKKFVLAEHTYEKLAERYLDIIQS